MGKALKYHILAWSVWKSLGDASLSLITSPKLCLVGLFSENKDSKLLLKEPPKQNPKLSHGCYLSNEELFCNEEERMKGKKRKLKREVIFIYFKKYKGKRYIFLAPLSLPS